MGTTSTLNSVLTALGGSTGIDVTAAVATILDAKRAPERAWVAQQTTLRSETSAISQLQNESSALSNTLTKLQNSDGALSSVSAITSNSSLLTASAVAGTPSSSHLITINKLASTASWYSGAQSSSSTALAGGSFDITTGGSTTTIQVSAGSTLNDLVASINSRFLGITANVITDSSGARLSLVSNTSGSAADLSVSNDSALPFTRANFGTDASIKVDEVPIQSASNIVSGAIAGVTLNLQGSSGAEINLSLAPDTTSITSAIGNFVSAYNTLIADVNSQFSYNQATHTAGTLQADSAIQSLQSELLAATNYMAGSGSYSTLTSLGINTNRDGTLSIDFKTLAAAIQTSGPAVAQLFQGTAGDGFVASLNATLITYTDPTQGAFTIDLKSISSQDQDLTAETNRLELYLTSQKTVLTAQYNAADIAIQQLPQKLKQIQALLNPNSSNSSL